MAIVQVSVTGNTVIYGRPIPSVQIRKQWDDEWIQKPYLQPISAANVAAPNVGSARFLWRYGNIKREDYVYYADGAPPFQQVAPLDIGNWYIRVRITEVIDGEVVTYTLWTGIVQEQNYAVFGGSAEPAGDQMITAHAIESILDRISIIGSYTKDGFINRCPTFNLRQEYVPHPVGNRTKDFYVYDSETKKYVVNNSVDEDSGEHIGCPLFGVNKELWTAKDAVRYILEFFVKPAGLTILIGGQPDALDNFDYVWQLESLTVRQALDKVIDRRRGLGWTIRAHDDNLIELFIFTTIETNVVLDKITVPANSMQVSLQWDHDILTEDAQIEITEGNRYDEIQVQGARVKTTFTASVEDGSLVPIWADKASNLKYAQDNKLPEGNPLYGADGKGASDEEVYQAIKNPDGSLALISDMIRATDQFRAVYQEFSIPDDWNWKAFGVPIVPNFDSNAYLLPVARDDNGTAISPPYFNEIQRPLLRQTIIKKPFTAKGEFAGNIEFQEPTAYAIYKTSTGEPIVEGGDTAYDELNRPIPILDKNNQPTYDANGNQIYQTKGLYIQGDLADRINAPSFSLQMLDILAGIEVRGTVPHIFGVNHFDVSASDSLISPAYDWKDLKATVCIETDVRPTVSVNISDKSAPYKRTLQIAVPHAEFWYLPSKTIIRQKPDLTFEVVDESYATRDDTNILREVAALAKAWYGKRRSVLRWTERRYVNELQIGNMVTNASSAWELFDINTVITAIEYDFERMNTRIQTGFGELDVAIMLDIPGMSDFRSVGRAFNTLKSDLQTVRGRVGSLPSRTVTSGGGSLIMGQVTSQNDDGTLNVDLYANGTNADSTGGVKNALSEIDGATVDSGTWVTLLPVNGQYYAISALTSSSSGGISADFFCDLFDRNEAGELNGYWAGRVGDFAITGGALKAINVYQSSTNIATPISVTSKDYVVKLEGMKVPPIPAGNSGGYINSGASQSFSVVFGSNFDSKAGQVPVSQGAAFKVTVSFETERNTASLNVWGNALTDRTYALRDLDKTITDSFDALNVGFMGRNPDGTPLVKGVFAGWGRVNNQDVWNFIGAGNFSSYVTATISKASYDAAIADIDTAYNSAVANLAQGLQGALSISLHNGATLKQLAPNVTVNGSNYTMLSETVPAEAELKITVSGNTMTVTFGDVSLSYSDASVIKNCKQLAIAASPATAQVSSIQAYRSDMPEPTQSGYGKYVPRAAGDTTTPETQYKDKYHTAKKDDKGKLTGYDYNPNA